MSASRSSPWRRRRSQRRARRRSSRKVEYEDLPALISVDDALAADADLAAAARDAARRRRRRARRARRTASRAACVIGGQDHFYLEGQVAYAIPARTATCSSIPRPSIRAEVQHTVANVLGASRQRGDGRGAAHGRRLRRQGEPAGADRGDRGARRARRPAGRQSSGSTATTTWSMTGKRHDFRIDYDVGFDDDGVIRGVRFDQAARCGYSADLSGADRRPRHVPRRQCLCAAQRAHPLAADEDAHGVEHRVPRLRRAAGHGRDRARDRRDRLRARRATRSMCGGRISIRPKAAASRPTTWR